MRLAAADKYKHPMSNSPNSFSRLSPVPNLQKTERPGSSLWQDESLESLPGLDTSRVGKHRGDRGIVGVVTGETSKHFMVKCQGAWIPVAKGQVKTAKGDSIPGLRLRDLKGKPVKVTKTNSFQPEAILIEEGLGSEVSFEVRLRDSDTEPGLAEDEGLRAYQQQVALTTDLCTDVVALTSLAHDPRRSEKYIQSRASRLKKNVSSAFATLRVSDPSLYSTFRPLCGNLLANFELVTGGQDWMCTECSASRAQVSLSCGHALCTYCAEELVFYSPEASVSDCPICGREMTLSEKRLILLEKYAGLAKARHF